MSGVPFPTKAGVRECNTSFSVENRSIEGMLKFAFPDTLLEGVSVLPDMTEPSEHPEAIDSVETDPRVGSLLKPLGVFTSEMVDSKMELPSSSEIPTR